VYMRALCVRKCLRVLHVCICRRLQAVALCMSTTCSQEEGAYTQAALEASTIRGIGIGHQAFALRTAAGGAQEWALKRTQRRAPPTRRHRMRQACLTCSTGAIAPCLGSAASGTALCTINHDARA
jgi:hypothetical protein